MSKSISDLILAHPAVECLYSEEGNLAPDQDDWWVHLRAGWQHDPETHLIHEQTLAEILEELGRVTRCNCADCTRRQAPRD